MANLKEVRVRISSVKSTRQITSAMKMVAASKLRRAQDSIIKMRPYALKLNEILQGISASLGESDDSLYGDQRDVKKVLLVPITSNRGLCGAFNANILKQTTSLINGKYKDAVESGKLDVISIGKKATDYFKTHEANLVTSYDDIFNDLVFQNTSEIAEKFMSSFVEKEYDEIILIYNRFKNAAVQELQVEQFLPIKPKEIEEGDTLQHDYIFEPSKAEIVEEMIPKSLKINFYKALLDSFASEHGARMTAMHQATDNADELLKDLKLTYNKARQAAITKEILEIVSGAEALKG